MDMHRTTILLPEDLKLASERFAKSRKISLGALIRQQLQNLVASAHANSTTQDAVFAKFVPYVGKAPANLALDHDEELYGARAASASQRKSK
jgi:hypothetical protein